MNQELVITLALKQECPDSFKALNIPVLSWKSIQSGADISLFKKSGVKVLITGVGRKNSEAAADWIASEIKPGYVVNMGTAGATSSSDQGWHRINAVTYAGTTLPVDARLPLFLPDIRSERMCHTCDVAQTGGKQETNYLVDMECFWQARRLFDTKIHFHCIKWVSDHCTDDSVGCFSEQLPLFRSEFDQLVLKSLNRDTTKISVVIPVYNRAHTIARCIKSVVNQRWGPHEIIVVDDGSTDDTNKVVQSFKSVRLIKLVTQKGVSYARNIGVQQSTGHWISFLDSDDEWLPQKLESQVAFIERYPFYKILQSEERWIRHGKPFSKKKIHAKPWGWCFDKCLERCLISPSSVILHRDLWDYCGGFKPTFPACEDYEMWIRLSRWVPVGLEPTESLIKYGGHSDQLSQKYEAMDRFRVKALTQALEMEQDPIYRNKLIQIRDQKQAILENGAKKRLVSVLDRCFEPTSNSH